MTPPSAVPSSGYFRELRELRLDNQSGLPHRESFARHRERLTRLAREAAATVESPQAPRLCVLGAGNCHDLDLAALADVYREIHLVDLDDEALQLATARQARVVADRITCHAPVDLSGMLDRIERWRELRLTEQELLVHPEATAADLERRTGGPFDVVVSACVLTQMQLGLLRGFGDQHRLFAALTHTLRLTHLRTLRRLVAPGGCAIFASDVTSGDIHPLDPPDPDADLRPLLDEAIAAGKAFYAADPRLLRATLGDDPVLRRDVELSEPLDAWLWQNGPQQRLLVYAVAMRRKA
jgi:hypothetical protein